MAINNRALSLATAGFLAGSAIALATDGFIQVDTGVAALQPADSVHQHTSDEVRLSQLHALLVSESTHKFTSDLVTWKAPEAPPDVYTPLPYAGGGTYYPLYTEEELRELEEQVPRTKLYEAIVELLLRSDTAHAHQSEALRYRYQVGSAYELLYSRSEARQNLDVYVPTAGPAFELQARSEGFLQPVTVRVEDYVLETRLESASRFELFTPEELRYKARVSQGLVFESLHSYETGQETLYELLPEPIVAEYTYPIALSHQLVSDVLARHTMPAERAVSSRLVLGLRLATQYGLQEHAVDLYRFVSTARPAVLEGLTAYRLNTAENLSYRLGSGGGSWLVSKTSAVFTFNPDTHPDIFLPEEDEDEALVFALIQYLLGRD